VALIAPASLIAGFVTAEATLVAPIAFFSAWLGFWLGLASFTASCVLFGVAVLGVTTRVLPERGPGASAGPPARGPVVGRVVAVARRSRPIGALVVAWYCGPFASPPILRAIGYQGRALLGWVLISGLLFGAFWFSLYAGGFRVLSRVLP
jgi:hypothetical protein